MNKMDYVASQIDLIDYYDKYIGPLNHKYGDKSWHQVKVVVCPLHNDHDASFGLMRDRHNKDIQRYHCFGCGATGNIINLYKNITYLQKGKNLTLEQSADALAILYNIKIDKQILSEQDDSIMGYINEGTTKTEELILNKNRPSVRNYLRNFNRIVALTENKDIDPQIIIRNYDRINSQYKEALYHK